MRRVTLYGRPDCHLCAEMRAVVDRVRRRTPFELTVVDISGDETLEAAYGLEIPVLSIDDRKCFVYEVDEATFRRRLRDGEASCK